MFATYASPLNRGVLEEARRLHGAVADRLEGYRASYFVSEAPVEIGGVGAALIATGGTERLLLESFERGFRPVIIAAHPSFNSLPAMLEARAALRGKGLSPLAVYVREPAEAASLLNALPRAVSISGSRLGLVGEPSPWLVASSVDADAAERVMGLELVKIGMEEFYREYRDSRPTGALDRVLGKCSVERPRAELEKALRVYTALKRLASRYRLDALTVRCFDILERLKTTACLALSLLNSEGLVAGCEGDMQSLVTMYLAHRLTGRPAWMANPARVEGDTILLAHCTAPIKWGVKCRLTTHFESGIGVGLDVALPRGKVVLARIDGRLERIYLSGALVKESGMGLPGLCRSQVRVKVEGDPWKLLDALPGNHVVVAPAPAEWGLRVAAALYGVEVVEPLAG